MKWQSWITWDPGLWVQHGGNGYRIAKAKRVCGMPYVGKTPSGRQRFAYFACRWNGQGYELLSIHASAGTARRACEADAATAAPRE